MSDCEVTMGKPFGNGMPLAAVVTTKEISDAFHNGLVSWHRHWVSRFRSRALCSTWWLGLVPDIGLGFLVSFNRQLLAKNKGCLHPVKMLRDGKQEFLCSVIGWKNVNAVSMHLQDGN